ncbi:MAG: PhoH family protein [Fidelibacterota bacterium]
MEKEIILRDVDPLLLLGINDSNFKVLERYFTSKIVVRGNKVILKGKSEDIDRIERILTEMVFSLNLKGNLSPDDVMTIIKLEDSQKLKTKEEKLNRVILFTKNGAVKPRTPGQVDYYKEVIENDIVFVIGPAGTGKTYLAVAFAIAAYKGGEVSKIILSRPAVEAGEKLGFLPGDLKEKVEPYLTPLYDALYDMIAHDKLKTLMEKRIIEVIPLAYMRGRTLNNAYVILDEAQNTSPLQMKMFLTRLGVNSRAIITGDITQVDLPENQVSGLIQIQGILSGIDGIKFVYLDERDVVRHKLVKKIILAYDKFNQEK